MLFIARWVKKSTDSELKNVILFTKRMHKDAVGCVLPARWLYPVVYDGGAGWVCQAPWMQTPRTQTPLDADPPPDADAPLVKRMNDRQV